jgi:hypothetical protein
VWVVGRRFSRINPQPSLPDNATFSTAVYGNPARDRESVRLDRGDSYCTDRVFALVATRVAMIWTTGDFNVSIIRTATVLLLAPVAAVIAAPEWVDSVGLDVFGVQAFQQELNNELERERDLEVTSEEVRRRIEIKESLIAELIAGRRSLTEVSARFLELNRERPDYMESIRSTYPGNTDEERSVSNVLSYVEAELAGDDSPRAAEVMTRIMAEYDCSRRSQGTTP